MWLFIPSFMQTKTSSESLPSCLLKKHQISVKAPSSGSQKHYG